MTKDLIMFGVSFILITGFMLSASIYLAQHDQQMKQGIQCHVYKCPPK